MVKEPSELKVFLKKSHGFVGIIHAYIKQKFIQLFHLPEALKDSLISALRKFGVEIRES